MHCDLRQSTSSHSSRLVLCSRVQGQGSFCLGDAGTSYLLCFILLKDWNTFLLRFNDLDLCVSENETLKHLSNDTTTPESTMTVGQARSSTQPPQSLEESGPINISVAITLTLDPLKPFGGYSRNVTHLYSTILGHQIGLSGVCQLLSFQSSEAAAELGSMFCSVFLLCLLLRLGLHEAKKDWFLCIFTQSVFRYHTQSLHKSFQNQD